MSEIQNNVNCCGRDPETGQDCDAFLYEEEQRFVSKPNNECIAGPFCGRCAYRYACAWDEATMIVDAHGIRIQL